ncbi:MAG TPA: DnaA regulatory inactivator Hda [Thiohalobacter sp.]|nr:DnaA regulatory inactivator Hda [Thiohalobacter sp.]
MATSLKQLALQLRLPDRARFANFHPGPNAEPVQQLQAFVEPAAAGSFFLWGRAGEGKSHLLMAAAHRVNETGGQAFYLSLAGPGLPSPQLLAEGLEGVDLLALDDIDRVAAQRDWEEALFALYNRVQQQGGRLLLAARARPDQCGFVLPDLVSRLRWGLVFGLRPLADADRIQVLQLRARQRGLELPEEVAGYLIKRYPRDLASLCTLLERLDAVSLQAQRRLTIPFIKQALERET